MNVGPELLFQLLQHLHDAGMMVRHPGCDHVGVHVHDEFHVTRGTLFREHAEHRQRIHVGAQALEMQANACAVVSRPRDIEILWLHHVGMGDDLRLPSPPSLDLARGAGGQRRQCIRSGDEDVQGGIMGGAVGLVRVAQVVDGVDEWPPLLLARCSGEVFGSGRRTTPLSSWLSICHHTSSPGR